MTTDELDALPAGTRIYLPTDWQVTVWELAGRVPGRNFYTLLHPPDQDEVVSNRWPVYIDAPQLLNATLDEKAAWLSVLEALNERKRWIYQLKLPK